MNVCVMCNQPILENKTHKRGNICDECLYLENGEKYMLNKYLWQKQLRELEEGYDIDEEAREIATKSVMKGAITVTIYEKLLNASKEEMVDFLYKFAHDTINAFGNFIMPSATDIREMLDYECKEE